MKYIILLLTCIIIISCTHPKEANKSLQALGFTDIEMTGYKWFACSESDFYHTGFKAINSTGKEVTGTVCSELWFKNSTVRF